MKLGLSKFSSNMSNFSFAAYDHPSASSNKCDGTFFNLSISPSMKAKFFLSTVSAIYSWIFKIVFNSLNLSFRCFLISSFFLLKTSAISCTSDWMILFYEDSCTSWYNWMSSSVLNVISFITSVSSLMSWFLCLPNRAQEVQILLRS